MKEDNEDLFIYNDDDLFTYDAVTSKDKKFIMDIIDQTNFNGDEDATIEIVDAVLKLKRKMNRMILTITKNDEQVKENMIVDEIKIKNEFANEIEKLKKKKKTYVQCVRHRMEMFKEKQ